MYAWPTAVRRRPNRPKGLFQLCCLIWDHNYRGGVEVLGSSERQAVMWLPPQAIVLWITLCDLCMASLHWAGGKSWGRRCSRLKKANSFHRYQSVQAFGIQEKVVRCLASGRRTIGLGTLDPFYLQGYVLRELKKTVGFFGTAAWCPGFWALWLLGAVDIQSSAWFSHCNPRPICGIQSQSPLIASQRPALGLRAREWTYIGPNCQKQTISWFLILLLDI